MGVEAPVTAEGSGGMALKAFLQNLSTIQIRQMLTNLGLSPTLAADLALLAPLAAPIFTGLLTLGTLAGATQSLSGAGAIDVVTLSTKLTTTGANALTLVDGVDGQVKIITNIVNAGNGTLTPTTKTGYSTIVFSGVGQSVILQFYTTKGWMVLSNNGAAVA